MWNTLPMPLTLVISYPANRLRRPVRSRSPMPPCAHTRRLLKHLDHHQRCRHRPCTAVEGADVHTSPDTTSYANRRQARRELSFARNRSGPPPTLPSVVRRAAQPGRPGIRNPAVPRAADSDGPFGRGCRCRDSCGTASIRLPDRSLLRTRLSPCRRSTGRCLDRRCSRSQVYGVSRVAPRPDAAPSPAAERDHTPGSTRQRRAAPGKL